MALCPFGFLQMTKDNIAGCWRAVYLVFREANDPITRFDQIAILVFIMGCILVPVLAIHLQSNAKFWQKEINTVTSCS